eukprot:2533621-Karenia_brevis.AAC.1
MESSMGSQVCPVIQALGSVSRMTKAGDSVVFNGEGRCEGSYIDNQTTGSRTYMRLESGVYLMDVWVKPPQPFQRQGA